MNHLISDIFEKYDIWAFQNRIDCPHMTSRPLFSVIWNLVIFVQIMQQIYEPFKKSKYDRFLWVVKKWSRPRMRTVDTVLESLDVILFRNFTYQVIHLSNLSGSGSQCTTGNP